MQLFSENSDQKVTSNQEQTIYRAIQAYLIILEAELSKSFIFINKSDVEYTKRLQDLIKLIELMYKVSREMSFHEDIEKEAASLSSERNDKEEGLHRFNDCKDGLTRIAK